MPNGDSSGLARRSEAERLIGLARAMLTDDAEQIAANYLDHAAMALRYLSVKADAAFTDPAMPPSPDPAQPAP